MRWKKSSYSNSDGNCVEVAEDPTTVYARDSKDQSGAVLAYPRPAWAAFIAAVKRGDLSR